MTETPDYLEEANELLEQSNEEPLTLEQYVDLIQERPHLASQSAKYLLEAIESMGKRTVIEDGEEKERWQFFDDPHNDGEHAILGNTEVLNQFVQDLRLMASDFGKKDKMVWFTGPTATGKSELKRCLINGLREYSKTPDGARYTLEWNVNSMSQGSRSGLSYGEEDTVSETDWYESPVQTHPLSVLPKSVRGKLLHDLNTSGTKLDISEDLDPFSKEAYNTLEKRYAEKTTEDLFNNVTAPKHLRVRRYTMNLGRGIGVLHSEDAGTPKQRLVGSWMNGMLQKLNSRGRKNPQAFSYDGVLGQGNTGLTIVEDASQHADLLQKLLNVPEEGMVKLDKKLPMDVETVMVLISNPDLEAQLDKQEAALGEDPFKALKRRLDKYEFTYLTSLSLEVELLRREVSSDTSVWTEDYDDKISEPVHLYETEVAPHTLEAAALYSVVCRLTDNDLPKQMDLVDKALIYERGYHEDGDEKVDKSEFAFDDDAADGENGIPVTYTRDIIGDKIQDVEDVLMPSETLDALVGNLTEAPVFSEAEETEYEKRVDTVKDYILEKQGDDVIAAILRDRDVDEEAVADYVEMVYEWNDETEDDPDPLRMKVFETEHLGRRDEEYGKNSKPSEEVVEFREERIITALKSWIWRQRNEDFAIEDSLGEIPVIEEVLGSYDWSDVNHEFPNLNLDQWDDPPSGTETEHVKEQCIENMIEMFDYSAESAERASTRVIRNADYDFGDD